MPFRCRPCLLVGKQWAKPKSKVSGASGYVHHVPEAEAQLVCQPGNFEWNTAGSGTVEISGIFLVPGGEKILLVIKGA